MSQTAKHRPILGCDIGNGFGYVSLLQQQAGDPLPLLPSKYQLSNLGMPTTATSCTAGCWRNWSTR